MLDRVTQREKNEFVRNLSYEFFLYIFNGLNWYHSIILRIKKPMNHK